MKSKKLTLVMRNSREIFNLLQTAQYLLKSEKTCYQLPKGKNDELRIKPKNDAKPKDKRVANDQLEKSYTSSGTRDPETSSVRSISMHKSNDLEYDQILAYLKLPSALGAGTENILESHFEYEEITDIGHKVEYVKPNLFELVDYEDEFQKIFTSTVIFKTLNIAKSNANSKHVVLRFKNDNEIPRKAFELLAYKHDSEESHLKVYHKIVYAFEQFEADNMGKYIFVGSFREFRGLEHSNITLIIDLDIEALRHYLVECIARCTTELNIVVLGSNEILTNITGSWKKNKLVKQ